MAKTDQFFQKLVGYHDVTVNGGSNLPRRSKLNIINGEVEDIDGATKIAITTKVSWLNPSQAISADQNNFSPTGFASLTEIAVDPTGATRTITGFDATNLTVFTKRIWNLTTDARDLVIAHNNSSSDANNSVLTPDSLPFTITPGSAAELVRNQSGTGWRLLS